MSIRSGYYGLKLRGYSIYGDGSATLYHSLGEYRIQYHVLGGREIPVHKPFRYYYLFRNSIALYKRPYTTWNWRRVDMLRLLKVMVFTMLAHPQRLTVLWMIQRGIRDGLRGIHGKL